MPILGELVGGVVSGLMSGGDEESGGGGGSTQTTTQEVNVGQTQSVSQNIGSLPGPLGSTTSMGSMDTTTMILLGGLVLLVLMMGRR